MTFIERSEDRLAIDGIFVKTLATDEGSKGLYDTTATVCRHFYIGSFAFNGTLAFLYCPELIYFQIGRNSRLLCLINGVGNMMRAKVRKKYIFPYFYVHLIFSF